MYIRRIQILDFYVLWNEACSKVLYIWQVYFAIVFTFVELQWQPIIEYRIYMRRSQLGNAKLYRFYVWNIGYKCIKTCAFEFQAKHQASIYNIAFYWLSRV